MSMYTICVHHGRCRIACYLRAESYIDISYLGLVAVVVRTKFHCFVMLRCLGRHLPVRSIEEIDLSYVLLPCILV